MFVNWLISRSLVASSTFSLDVSALSPVTRIPDEHCDDRDVVPRQIDYVLTDYVTHYHRHCNTYIDSDIADNIGSDHFMIISSYNFDPSNVIHFDSFAEVVWEKPKKPCRMITWQPYSLLDFQIGLENRFRALEDSGREIDLDMIVLLPLFRRSWAMATVGSNKITVPRRALFRQMS